MHADQYMVFNFASMNAGTMSDCNIVPDDARIIICYMQAAEILYIGAFANGNVVDIASCNNAWPDAGIFSDSYRNTLGATKAFGSICGTLPLNC
jgi:butyrate kinase